MVVDSSYELRERLAYYRDIVANAVKRKRVFRLATYTCVNKLRGELYKRKFLEQISIPKGSAFNGMTIAQLLEKADEGNDYEKALITKLLGDRQPDLVWCSRSIYDFYAGVRTLNRLKFVDGNFTLKHSMIDCAWRINEDLAPKGEYLAYPRAYEITDVDGFDEFQDEFNWTTVTSLILYMKLESESIDAWFSDRHWSLNSEGLQLALRLIDTKVAELHGVPTEGPGFLSTSKLTPRHWRLIHDTYRCVVTVRQRFWGNSHVKEHFNRRITQAAEAIFAHWPERRYDGYKNMWMVKPADSGQGEGILVSSNVQQMVRYVRGDNRLYVAQKYIEKPLLVYDTKFDIRQYFVISIDDTTLRAWASPLCTIKLASREFDLDDFRESVHVTNTTVQSRYINLSSDKLPDHHMWSIDDLKYYFKRELEMPTLFEDKIFPAMKKTLRQVCETCYDDIELRSGRFELFGCDWMITEDFETVLLEINRHPSLEHYTNISTYVIGEILEDVMKVGVDAMNNPKVDTGGFEKIFEVNIEDSVIIPQTDSGYCSRKASVENTNFVSSIGPISYSQI